MALTWWEGTQILLPTGEAVRPHLWQPEIVDLQLLVMGDLVVIVAPGEFSTSTVSLCGWGGGGGVASLTRGRAQWPGGAFAITFARSSPTAASSAPMP
jgi:hypothetical protein